MCEHHEPLRTREMCPNVRGLLGVKRVDFGRYVACPLTGQSQTSGSLLVVPSWQYRSSQHTQIGRHVPEFPDHFGIAEIARSRVTRAAECDGANVAFLPRQRSCLIQGEAPCFHAHDHSARNAKRPRCWPGSRPAPPALTFGPPNAQPAIMSVNRRGVPTPIGALSY
jgi:hypothetical protein